MVATETDVVNLALMHLGNQPITDIDGTDTVALLAAEVYDQNRDYILTLREWGSAVKRTHLAAAGLIAVTAATKAKPPVVTCSGHLFLDGQLVTFSGIIGMTELNQVIFRVADKAANTFELTDMEMADVDGTAYTTYSSGGYAFLSPGGEWSYAYDLPSDCLRPIEILDEDWTSPGLDHYAYAQEGRVLYTNVENAALRYMFQQTDPSKYDSQLVDAMALRLAWVLSNKITGTSQGMRQDLDRQVSRMRVQAGLMDARAKQSRVPREKPWR